MRKLIISGYYGFDNSGDEAVLQAIIDALEKEAPFIVPVVLSANPEKTSREYKVEAVNRFKLMEVIKAIKNSDGLISGGGSLLQDETGKLSIPYYMGIIKIAQFFKKPTFIYSQGIGPVHSKLFYPLIRSGFNKSNYISVRDPASKQLLDKMNVSKEIAVITDPVLNLLAISDEKLTGILKEEGINESPVVFSIRFWKENKDYLDTVAKVADELIAIGEQVIFVPMHEPEDREASLYVMGKMEKKAVLFHSNHPRQVMGLLGKSKCLIGMRLHSLIFATAMGTPSLGISYDPKIDNFLSQINRTPVGTTDDLEFKTLFDEVRHVIHHVEEKKEELKKLTPRLKERAYEPAKYISKYFVELEETFD